MVLMVESVGVVSTRLTASSARAGDEYLELGCDMYLGSIRERYYGVLCTFALSPRPKKMHHPAADGGGEEGEWRRRHPNLHLYRARQFVFEQRCLSTTPRKLKPAGDDLVPTLLADAPTMIMRTYALKQVHKLKVLC